jgi:hypothetical protein
MQKRLAREYEEAEAKYIDLSLGFVLPCSLPSSLPPHLALCTEHARLLAAR